MKRFASSQVKATIIPLFEWAVDGDGHAIIEDGKTDYDEVFEILDQKCLDWLNIEGHLIIHYSIGVDRVLDEETRYYPADYLKFIWQARNYTSVFGIILDDSPVSRNSFLSDFCKILDVEPILRDWFNARR